MQRPHPCPKDDRRRATGPSCPRRESPSLLAAHCAMAAILSPACSCSARSVHEQMYGSERVLGADCSALAVSHRAYPGEKEAPVHPG
ncbi:hypothetical protein GY45DRAFT_210698 [Cubamyces sp. BRFM 1775]|nr:hypothetical protein GY45DRAFT_210698 [Cubamyces sp. BRFM 1775]